MILDAKMHKIYVYKIYGYDNGFQQLLMGNDGPHAGTCQQVPSLLPHGEPQRSAGRLRIRSERRPL